MGCIVGRIGVRYVLHRVRPYDPENACAGTKDLTDGLRRSGLIPEDNPWTISLTVDQVKVRHYHEEKTEIFVTYPNGRDQ